MGPELKEKLSAVEPVWTACAAKLGLTVVRTAEVYAASDGRGRLLVGTPDTLDDDDSLAQMIFHELCHALVEGPAAHALPDWGLDNTSARDVPHEHACLKLQAYLARRHGLDEVLVPTTEFRGYYESLGPEPLAARDEDDALAARLAAAGLARAGEPPFAAPLDEALAQTARHLGIAPHPSGLGYGRRDRCCGSCAWRYLGGPGRLVPRCRQAAAPARPGPRIRDELGACERWEPRELDCQRCAACCREAYHSVTIGRRDPVRRRHPELVVDRGAYLELARRGTFCAALERVAAASRSAEPGEPGDPGDPGEPNGTKDAAAYRCLIYEERPRPCREFERGGPNCLQARRRVGLSAG